MTFGLVVLMKLHTIFTITINPLRYDSLMTNLYELRRLIAKAVEPNDEDVTQTLGFYPTLDEADLALDAYQSR